MSIMIISDLHLEETRPDISDLFLNFLKKEATVNAQALYILGDFFEAWIGDDDFSSFNQRIIKELREATTGGLPIYFMHGNRDFLIGRRFLKETGCRLLPEEYVIHLYGVPTLMMHGDTLCTDDVKYLKFRKKSRKWFWQKLMLLKSIEKRRALVKKYREASKLHISTLPDHIMDVTQHEVERKMIKHSVESLIHGHTHRLGVHLFQLNEKLVSRTVLGAWHEEGSALVCDPTGKNFLIEIK